MSATMMVLGSLFKNMFKIIDKAVPDKDMAEKIKAEMMVSQHRLIKAELDAASQIIISESKGNALQRNWRPLLMCTVMMILFNNYILIPYARAFGWVVPILEIPDGLWTLLTLGVGGYVVGRSGEKIALNLKKPPIEEKGGML